ncbi:MAG: mechanosensitive ion channel [Sedimentisphaerales bacterium]|nr:mechanosensitive ion channel [Sedimentisphaerales bacterium]
MHILQKTGFQIYPLRIKYLAKIFLILLSGIVSITANARQEQNIDANSPAAQDANSAEKPTLITSEIVGSTTVGITLEEIQTNKRRVAESQELNAELKTKIDEIYNQAITFLDQAEKLEKSKQDYAERRKNASIDLETVKAQLAKQTTFAEPIVPTDITLAEAERNLAEAASALDKSQKDTATLENEQAKRSERRTKIPEESTSAKQKIEEIQTKLSSPPAEGQSPELTQANKIFAEVQRRLFEATIETNTEELLCYDARRDVLATQRDFVARQLVLNEKLLGFWQQQVNDLRQKQAQSAQKEAILAKEGTKYSHKIIQEIAEYNVTLAKLQAQLADKVEKSNTYSNTIQEQLTAIDKEFRDVKQQISIAGDKITDVMGVLLLTKRNELPDIQKNKRQIKSRLTEMSQAQLALIKYDKEWRELSIIEQYVSNLVIEPPVSDSERQIIQADATNYLKNRRNTLDAITDSYSRYSTVLATLDAKENSFIKIVQDYQNFIDKNILWVKSSTKPGFKDFAAALSAFQWLIHPQNWKQAADVLWDDFKKVPFAHIAIILVFSLAFLLHKKIHASVTSLSQKVLDINTDSFLHTLKTFVLTTFLASTWPVIILFLLWRLSLDTSGSEFVLALSGGMKELAWGIFIFEFLRHMTMPSGLMQDHFRVRPESLTFARKHMHWFFVLLIPLTFIFRILQIEQQNNELFNNTIGLLIFIAILVAVAIFLLKLLRPSRPLVEPYLKRNRDGWVERLRYVWYPLCLLLPVTFSVLALMGYFYAAWHLYEKLIYTLCLVFMVFVFRALLNRWLIVIRRKLSIIEKQKREAAARQDIIETNGLGGSDNSSSSQQNLNKPEKTIFEISQQTNRLINAAVFILTVIGLWYVWQDVIPALSSLGDITLWKTTSSQGTEIKNITLGLLIKALIITVMTVIVARNVPGLLEIVVLRKIPIDAGARFAITTICRYIIVIVGLILAFIEIGIGWSKVQWLVAAMTVGLGFGLQEIFANFVSGLIILFEQPVRVDDVVTVGEATGTVTKIKIRATTIRKWDQTELILPNKEFITGQLINWTLSDKVLRIVFRVGIAYGSDIAKAEKILYEIAAANPHVLDNPKPMVLFRNFGSSSLEFELRVYISGMENNLPVWHDINCAINEVFRKANIEIAFPQQDVHIRSVVSNLPTNFEKMP